MIQLFLAYKAFYPFPLRAVSYKKPKERNALCFQYFRGVYRQIEPFFMTEPSAGCKDPFLVFG